MKHVNGLIAAVHTPFKENGSLNLDTISQQYEFLRNKGLAGVFMCGTTGEGMLLSMEERKAVAVKWSDTIKDAEFKLFVHVGHTSVNQSCELAEHAKSLDVYAISAMAPCFFRPSTLQALIDVCSDIASAATDLPFYYYHMPAMTGVNFLMIDLLRALNGKINNFAGIKFTGENLMDYQKCLFFDNSKYDILFGRDEILLAGLACGATGAVGSTYNFCPDLYFEIIKKFQENELDTARQLQLRSQNLIELLRRSACCDIVASKAAMKLHGIDCGPVRLPLSNINQSEFEELVRSIHELGL